MQSLQDVVLEQKYIDMEKKNTIILYLKVY